MADLPEGFTMRPPVAADGEPLVRLINEESTALIGRALVTLEWVVTPWQSPGSDLERDFAVVVAPDGLLAGYLSLRADPPFTALVGIGVVGLSYHGRGIGSAIVAETERRARGLVELAPPGVRVVLRVGTLSGEPRVAQLLTGRGYAEVRRFVEMRIDFDGPPDPPAPIDGVEIRPAVVGEEVAVYECLGGAFADHWGESWPSEEAWLHENAESGDADLELWQLAWAGDELAGALLGTPEAASESTLGHVTELGVRRAHRRRGIGEALLRTSFRQFHARGMEGVNLHVDTESITGATRLYERVGMTPAPAFASWERELRPGRDPG